MLKPEHISKLWIKMVRIYGHRWRSSFGDADDGTWLTGLKHLTPEQLATGLSDCIVKGGEWPPSLPEFRSMCLQLPRIEAIVQGALNGSRDPICERLRKMVDSHSRNSLSYNQLAIMYRVKAHGLIEKIQLEKLGIIPDEIDDQRNKEHLLRYFRK